MKFTVRIALISFLVFAACREWRIGLADNGDFQRAMKVFTSGPVGSTEAWPSPGSEAWHQRFFAFYIEDWRRDWPMERPATSAPLVWAPGALLSAALSPPGVLSLPIVSLPMRCVPLLLLLALFRWIDRAAPERSTLLSITLGGMFVVVLTVVPYAAYLNSFYQEAASFVMVLLVLASVLLLDAEPGSGLRLGLGIAAVVVLGATRAGAIYWPLIGIPVLLSLYAPVRRMRPAAVTALVVGAVVCAELAVAGITVSESAAVNRYHSLFNGALTFSERPGDHLASMGATEQALGCVGVSAFEARGGECLARNRSVLSFVNTAWVFVREPGALVRTIFHATGSMQDISLDYLGRYAESDPRSLSAPPNGSVDASRVRYRGQASEGLLDAFSAIKFEIFPTGPALIVVLGLFAAWFWRTLSSSGLSRGLSIAGLICTAACGMDMAVAILGDGRYELIKHLAMANLLFDLAAIAFVNTLIVAALARGAGRSA